MEELVLKTGMFRLSSIDNLKDTEFSVSKFLKKIFIKFGITFTDPCCPVTDIQPLRYDSGSGNIQTFDGKIWVNLGSFPA